MHHMQYIYISYISYHTISHLPGIYPDHALRCFKLEVATLAPRRRDALPPGSRATLGPCPPPVAPRSPQWPGSIPRPPKLSKGAIEAGPAVKQVLAAGKRGLALDGGAKDLSQGAVDEHLRLWACHQAHTVIVE